MRAAAIAFFHDAVAAATPATADFYAANTPVDIAERLQARRAWVKLYMPSEEGDEQPFETHLVTIDCGALGLEEARATAEIIRSALKTSGRDPSPFRRRRIASLPDDEGRFHRVQLSYEVSRPAIEE